MDLEKIKLVRSRTQASYSECKYALEQTKGDIDKACRFLGVKGMRMLNNNSTGENGIVYSYIHPGGRIGVLVEVHCETDFVARTEEFQQFAKEVSLQVASMKPEYVSRDSIPTEDFALEYNRRLGLMLQEGVSDLEDDSVKELVNAEMIQWFADVCLLEQPYVKDNSKIVKELLAELVNKVGESCRIKKFVRWEIGSDEGEIKTADLIEENEETLKDMKFESMRNKFGNFSFILLLLFLLSILYFLPFIFAMGENVC